MCYSSNKLSLNNLQIWYVYGFENGTICIVFNILFIKKQIIMIFFYYFFISYFKNLFWYLLSCWYNKVFLGTQWILLYNRGCIFLNPHRYTDPVITFHHILFQWFLYSIGCIQKRHKGGFEGIRWKFLKQQLEWWII